MTELTLFASTFLLVMLLGMQSLNTNNGHYWAAFFTSFGIGASNLVLFKLAPDANTTEMAAYLLGGPFGILAAMWLHPKLSLWIKRRECSRTFKRAVQSGILSPNEARAMKNRNRVTANTNCGGDRP